MKKSDLNPFAEQADGRSFIIDVTGRIYKIKLIMRFYLFIFLFRSIRLELPLCCKNSNIRHQILKRLAL